MNAFNETDRLFFAMKKNHGYGVKTREKVRVASIERGGVMACQTQGLRALPQEAGNERPENEPQDHEADRDLEYVHAERLAIERRRFRRSIGRIGGMAG